MKSKSKTYKRLGDYIEQVNVRNRELLDVPLMGLSINKVFIPSIANTIGTNMANYKVINRNQFAYGPVTSRNGEKITIALFKDYDQALISQAYVPFEITKQDELLPDYLMMWFSRPEFDRYARFKSHGSARETFDWEEMCDVRLPIPSIGKQQQIVDEYQSIENKIKVNEQICEKLEDTAQAIYREWFVEFNFPDEDGKPYKDSGGKMVWSDELDKEVPEGWEVKELSLLCEVKGGKRLPKGMTLNNDKDGIPYIRVADMSQRKHIVLDNSIQYVTKNIQQSILQYIVETGDIIISIVGTIGVINIVDETLDNANLTENCYRLTDFKHVNKDYIYSYLRSFEGEKDIESRIVGGVQGKLPMYNVKSMELIIPNARVLNKFEDLLLPINGFLKVNANENPKLTEIKSLLLTRMAKQSNN